jgi:hypothetical protein
MRHPLNRACCCAILLLSCSALNAAETVHEESLLSKLNRLEAGGSDPAGEGVAGEINPTEGKQVGSLLSQLDKQEVRSKLPVGANRTDEILQVADYFELHKGSLGAGISALAAKVKKDAAKRGMPTTAPTGREDELAFLQRKYKDVQNEVMKLPPNLSTKKFAEASAQFELKKKKEMAQIKGELKQEVKAFKTKMRAREKHRPSPLIWALKHKTRRPTAEPTSEPTSAPNQPTANRTETPSMAPTKWKLSSFWASSKDSRYGDMHEIKASDTTADSQADLDWIASSTYVPTAQPTAPTLSPTRAPSANPTDLARKHTDELSALKQKFKDVQHEVLKRKKGVPANDPAYMAAYAQFEFKKKKREEMIEKEIVQKRTTDIFGNAKAVKTWRRIPTPVPTPDHTKHRKSSAMDWVKNIISPIVQRKNAVAKAQKEEEEEEERRTHSTGGTADISQLWRKSPKAEKPLLRLTHLHIGRSPAANKTNSTGASLLVSDALARSMHRTYWYLFPELKQDQLPEVDVPTTRPTSEKTYWNLLPTPAQTEAPVRDMFGAWYLPITKRPTSLPTTAPTAPTTAPTSLPTHVPTPAPSVPTSTPTSVPTTQFPTHSPTTPTEAPTAAPTFPTSSPTPAPTGYPTISECKQQCASIDIWQVGFKKEQNVELALEKQGLDDPCSLVMHSAPGTKGRKLAARLCACFDHCGLTNTPLLPSFAPTAQPTLSPSASPSLNQADELEHETDAAEGTNAALELKAAPDSKCDHVGLGSVETLGCFALSLTTTHAVLQIKFDLVDSDSGAAIRAFSSANGLANKQKFDIDVSTSAVDMRGTWSTRVPRGSHILTYLLLPANNVCLRGAQLTTGPGIHVKCADACQGEAFTFTHTHKSTKIPGEKHDDDDDD